MSYSTSAPSYGSHADPDSPMFAPCRDALCCVALCLIYILALASHSTLSLFDMRRRCLLPSPLQFSLTIAHRGVGITFGNPRAEAYVAQMAADQDD